MTPAIDAVDIVEILRSIHAHAHEEMMVAEEPAPFVVDQNGVCLYGLVHTLVRPAVFFHELTGLVEEGDSAQSRLAALPCKLDIPVGLRVEIRSDKTLELLDAHSLRVFIKQQLLGKEEAVLAVDVASRPRRFDGRGEGFFHGDHAYCLTSILYGVPRLRCDYQEQTKECRSGKAAREDAQRNVMAPRRIPLPAIRFDEPVVEPHPPDQMHGDFVRQGAAKDDSYHIASISVALRENAHGHDEQRGGRQHRSLPGHSGPFDLKTRIHDGR